MSRGSISRGYVIVSVCNGMNKGGRITHGAGKAAVVRE